MCHASVWMRRLLDLLEDRLPGFCKAATRFEEDGRKAGCARSTVGRV